MKYLLITITFVLIMGTGWAGDTPDSIFIESESNEFIFTEPESNEMVTIEPARLKINLDKFRNSDNIEFCFDDHCYNFEIGYIENVIFKITH